MAKYRKGTKVNLKIGKGQVKGKVLEDSKVTYYGANSKKPQQRRQVVVRAGGQTYYVDPARVKKRLI